MSSCIFSAVENPFYHTIIDSRFSEQLSASNSSFERCAIRYQNRTYLTGGTKSFLDITFTFNGGYTQGGAICAKGSSDVAINNCLFDKCKVTGNENNTGRGGALFCENGKCVVSDSIFTNCTGSYADGAVSFWFGTKRVLHKCRIVDCSGPQHFGGMNFEQAPENESQISECEYSKCWCSIDGDSCRGCGGALGIVNPPPHLFITSIKFQNNRAVRHGGAIMCFLALSGSSFRCRFLFFSNNSGRSQGGSDIYTDHNFAGKLDSTQFETCYSFSAAPRFVYCNSDGSYPDAANKPDWLPTPSFPNIYVKNGGHDTNDCGNSTGNKECLTLKFSITRWTPIFNQKIIVNGGTYTETSLDISDRVIVADSQTSIPKIVSKISSGTFCTITNGSFSASNLIFVHNSSTSSNAIMFSISEEDGVLKLIKSKVTAESGQGTSFSKSLFVINDGHLILDQTTITAIKASKPVLSLIFPREFTTTQSVFSQISRTNGNGSVLEATLEAGQILHLANFSLSECSCSEGNGGGMWVYMKAGSSFRLGNATGASVSGREANANEIMGFTSCAAHGGSEPKYGCGGGVFLYLENGATDFIFKDVSFSSCTAESGKNIFVSANSLSTVITNTTIAFGPDLSSNDGLRGYERLSLGATFAIPLLIYLKPFASPACVGGSFKADINRCGFPSFPCSTINFAVTTHFYATKVEILLVSPFSFNAELKMETNEWDISTTAQGTKFEVSLASPTAQAGFIESSILSTITNITFSVPQTLTNKDALLLCSSDTLKVINCGLTAATSVSSIQFSFVKVASGSLLLKNFDASSLSFTAVSFISVSSGSQASVNAELSSFEDITLSNGCILSAEEVLRLQITSSNFSKITRSQGDSGCVAVKSITGVANSKAMINNCEFEDINLSENRKNGGSVYLQLSTPTLFEVNNACFTSSKVRWESPSGEGRGGAVYLSLVDSAADYTFYSNVTFASNKAKYGPDLFVYSTNLNESVKIEKLNFFNPINDASLLAGEDSSKNGNVVLLKYYLIPREFVISVSSANGVDVAVCGFAAYPCGGLSYAFALGTGDVTLSVIQSSKISQELSLSGRSYTINGDTARTSALDIVNNGTGTGSFVTCASAVLFSHIEYIIPPQLGSHASLFGVGGGTLTLSSCAITKSSADNLQYTLFNVIQGDLIINELHTTSLTCTKPMLVVNGTNSAAAITDCSFTSASVTTAADALFVICNEASLSLTSSDITNTAQSKPIISSAANCGLNMDRCKVSSLQLTGNSAFHLTKPKEFSIINSNFTTVSASTADGSCISISDDSDTSIGTVTISMCNFTDCKVTGNGNGGAIASSLKSGLNWNVSGCIFDNCHAPSGISDEVKGGAVFITLSVASSNFVIETPSFGTNSAKLGLNLFVISPSLRDSVKETTLPFLKPATESTNRNSDRIYRAQFSFSTATAEAASFDSACGYDSADQMHSIPLVLFFRPPPTAFSVNGTGIDNSICGYSDYQCKTINFACDRQTTLVKEVKIDSNAMSFSEELVLSDAKYNIYGLDANTTLTVASAGTGTDGLVTSSAEATLSHLIFMLPSLLGTHTSFISVTSPADPSSATGIEYSFKMSSIAFAIHTAANLNYNIIKATYGHLKMRDCDVTVPEYKKSLFVFSSSVSSVSVEATNFKGFSGTSEPAFTCLEPPSPSNVYTTITLNNSMFKELSQAIDHPASIVKDTFAAWNTIITNASFLLCVAGASLRGGGLRMCLSMEGSLEVSNSMFVYCIASSEGRGGGLYLDCVDPADPLPNPIPKLPFRMNSIRFNNNDAKVGKDVFINCHNISEQIDETIFDLDYEELSIQADDSFNAEDTFEKDKNFIPLINLYKNKFIFLSAVDSDDSMKQCGSEILPCKSINVGIIHLSSGFVRVVFIKDATSIANETKIKDATVKPYAINQAVIELNASIDKITPDASILTLVNEVVMNNLDFCFSDSFSSQHKAVLYLQSGSLDAKDISFSSMAELSITPSLFYVAAGDLKLANCTITSVNCILPMFYFSSTADGVEFSFLKCYNSCLSSSMIEIDNGQSRTQNISLEKMELKNISLSSREAIGISCDSSSSKASITISSAVFESISRTEEGPSAIKAELCSIETVIAVVNCTFTNCEASSNQGSIASFDAVRAINVNDCSFCGENSNAQASALNEDANSKEMCKWNGSLVHLSSAGILMEDSVVSNSLAGGCSLENTTAALIKCEFRDNNPKISNFSSVRRNIRCSNGSSLNIASVGSGGDGLLPNSSFWIVADECQLSGVVTEWASPLFVPTLNEVELEYSDSSLRLLFKGTLLLPCNLSFKIAQSLDNQQDEIAIEYDFIEFINENEAAGLIPSSSVTTATTDCIFTATVLFVGNSGQKRETSSVVLINASDETKQAEGKVQSKDFDWKIVVIIVISVLLVALALAFVVVLLRKRKNEQEKRWTVECGEATGNGEAMEKEYKTLEMPESEMISEGELESNSNKVAEKGNESEQGRRWSEEEELQESRSEAMLINTKEDGCWTSNLCANLLNSSSSSSFDLLTFDVDVNMAVDGNVYSIDQSQFASPTKNVSNVKFSTDIFSASIVQPEGFESKSDNADKRKHYKEIDAEEGKEREGGEREVSKDGEENDNNSSKRKKKRSKKKKTKNNKLNEIIESINLSEEQKNVSKNEEVDVHNDILNECDWIANVLQMEEEATYVNEIGSEEKKRKKRKKKKKKNDALEEAK
ncbi:uncharacterized protein MONOS_8318 [Monocercomonoides exilis]|uniref:uncharacterized protein n=1 Tax=Monocercomonoides exilis TaxID=2049356 RepID=UPI003559D755|nr:hypothetical protein MONOS_8318 [Monocercomonoides exilis]|eukprot:MONOS_8318.1-p1 / transcript=MONOS_8318.1 / gene=MONOS_8318 / organism=Monocercomonoides_exilis_PA203 / gene_product=unspecified product / transcript_product=unspecified product / location=Mono_scaffold00311:35050-43212(-) / protein_length=2721 / sequence_SO=supercontig / SO=protein_coding / is_pseudo=false